MTCVFDTWTIYDHPSDHPMHWVARQFVVHQDGTTEPTDSIILADDLERLRLCMLTDMGKVAIARSDEDDPVIVETWI